MDVLVCNGLGIYCGMKTLEWLSLKTYKWQGLWNIPTYKYVSRAADLRAWALVWGLRACGACGPVGRGRGRGCCLL